MLRWAEPFDQYGGDEAAMLQGSFAWAQVDAGAFVLSTTQKRTGTYSLRFDATSNTQARRVFGDDLTEATVGFAIFLDNLPGSQNVFDGGHSNGGFLLATFRDGANLGQVTFQLATNGQIQAYSGGGHSNFPSGTLLGTSDPTVLVPASAFSHLEFLVGCDASDGYIEIRLNGVTIMNLTGVNTDPTTAGVLAQWTFGYCGLFSSGCTGYIDDLDASDDTGPQNVGFLGDLKWYWLPPTSDLTPEDFTPSSGADSYAMVDESPPNDADYLSIVGTGMTVVGHAALPGDVAAIRAVIALQRSWKDDAGTCEMKPGIRQGATYASGAGQAITTVAGYYGQVFEVDPVSGVPFTPAEVNSLAQVIERSA